MFGLQRAAGNTAVARLLGGRAVVQRSVEPAGSPGRRPNLDSGDSGPGVSLLQRMLGAGETGVFDAQTRGAVDTFQRRQGWDPSGVGPMTWAALDGHAGTPGSRPNLVQGDRGPGVRLLQQLLGVPEIGVFGPATRKAADAFQRAQGWEPSGVGPMTWAALDGKITAGADAPLDPMRVVVPGTWIDDFSDAVYDMNYRIGEKGGPSEWIQVRYVDGTQIDLNWYDFGDVSLTTDQMTSALKGRHAGLGGRIFPGASAGAGRLGLTRQLCPRLWALRQEADEIGADSTLKLTALSLNAVVFVLTVPTMPAGPPPADAPGRSLRAERRPIPRGGGGSPASSAAAKLQAALDYYPGHTGAVGTLEAPGRAPMRIKSGVEGGPWGGAQRGGIPRGKGEAYTSGGPSQGNIATHVEGHSAAIMHQQGITEATLTMGMDQCTICASNLPTALPPGSTLTVVHVDGASRISITTYRSSQLP